MSLSVLSSREYEKWDETVKSFKQHDIYYMCGYARTVSFQTAGEPLLLFYEDDKLRAMNVIIKRDIAAAPEFKDKISENTYFDIITPYGYGGWICEGDGDRAGLFEEYAGWCRDNRVVSEFIRLHPIFNNWQVYDESYEIIYSRHTVGTALQLFEDPVQAEFSKSVRRDVRRAQSAGVKCEVIENPADWTVFRRLYEETMDRNGADAEYYFPDEYYEQIVSDLRDCSIEIRAEAEDGEVIGSEMYFTAGKLMHAHLLGSNHRLTELHAGALLEATAAQWGKSHGYEYIHHGGGRSSDPEDALYLYKKKFGKNTEFDFYVGKKIWDEESYEMLLNLRGNREELLSSGYFPAYRK